MAGVFRVSPGVRDGPNLAILPRWMIDRSRPVQAGALDDARIRPRPCTDRHESHLRSRCRSAHDGSDAPAAVAHRARRQPGQNDCGVGRRARRRIRGNVGGARALQIARSGRNERQFRLGTGLQPARIRGAGGSVSGQTLRSARGPEAAVRAGSAAAHLAAARPAAHRGRWEGLPADRLAAPRPVARSRARSAAPAAAPRRASHREDRAPAARAQDRKAERRPTPAGRGVCLCCSWRRNAPPQRQVPQPSGETPSRPRRGDISRRAPRPRPRRPAR